MTQKKETDSTEYELKIDVQVEKYLEMKQKLMYFLITASTAVTAFLVKFLIDHRHDANNFIWLAVASSVSGLLATGFSLMNLHWELLSYRLHIANRYRRKRWDDLEEREQAGWEKIKSWAGFQQKSAFIFLFIEIATAVAFFAMYFCSK